MHKRSICGPIIACGFALIASMSITPPTAVVAAPEGVAQAGVSHVESKRLVVRGDDGRQTLQTFCLGADGKLFALVSAPNFYGASDGAAASQGGEVRVFDADGKPLVQWKVAFTPQRIGAAPGGEIIVGGSGRLAKFAPDGKLLAEIESPHLAAVLADKEALRVQAEAQLKSSVEMYSQQIEMFDEQIKRLEERVKNEASESKSDEKKPAEAKPAATSAIPIVESSTFLVFDGEGQAIAAPNAKQQLDNMRRIRENYVRMKDMFAKKTVDDVIQEVTQRLQRIHGIAVSDDHVYVATAVSKGYGYAVWRTTPDFGEAKQIVSGLSGCCGQIDIQAKGDELFVAENSRHRVVRYDRDGKQLGSWGKRDRDGAGAGFGGCCNPMNLCFTGNGEVVTAESEGHVKCFSPAGDFVELLGDAKVGGGCKNVAVAVSKDGKHLYFYDQTGSQIIIMDRKDSSDATKKPGAKEVGSR